MSDAMLSPGSAPSRLAGGRSWGSRGARSLAVVLIALGLALLIDAGVTLVWQEPISALYALLRQDRLSGDLRRVEGAAPTAAERRTLASLADERQRIAFLARELQRRSSNGSAVGRIVIPRIGASYVVVDGTDTDDLESGPGIYRETSFPGISGTTAIAGHRTTYLAPFRKINMLSRGDRIVLEMPYGRFIYTVSGQRVVAPTDVQAAVARLSYSRLVLSACTPLFSAEKRLLVYARLTRIVPLGAARRLPGGALAQPIEAPAPRAGHRRRRLPPVLESLDPHLAFPV
jgi:sortase A